METSSQQSSLNTEFSQEKTKIQSIDKHQVMEIAQIDLQDRPVAKQVYITDTINNVLLSYTMYTSPEVIA